MDANTQNNSAPITLPPDIDPQGILGSFLGKLAGGLVGKAIGGHTGSTVGSIAGGALGSFLPLSAGPGTAGSQVSELEMQSFFGTYDKLKTICNMGGARPLGIGKGLSLFEAGPTGASQPAVSDLEMQNFWGTFSKIASTVGKVAGTAVNVGHGLGLFEAGPTGAAQPAVSDLEMQSFWDTFSKIAKTVVNTAGTVANVGHGLGLFEAGPTGAPQVSETELQNFANVWGKVSGVVSAIGKIPPAQPTSGQQASGMSSDQAVAILRQVSPVLQTLLQRPAGLMN